MLDADGGGERMSVVVETEPGCDPAVAGRLRRELHDLLALSPEVRLCPVGTLERPQGKAVRVARPPPAPVSDLTALFAPRSVAVLGVSRNPAKLGYRLLRNVLEGGFEGAVHPVNPSGEPILGVPTVRTIDALPEAVDLALVSLPAPAVPEAIAALAARGVRAAVILSSGLRRSRRRGPRRPDRAAGDWRVAPGCAWSGPTAWASTPRPPGSTAPTSGICRA